MNGVSTIKVRKLISLSLYSSYSAFNGLVSLSQMHGNGLVFIAQTTRVINTWPHVILIIEYVRVCFYRWDEFARTRGSSTTVSASSNLAFKDEEPSVWLPGTRTFSDAPTTKDEDLDSWEYLPAKIFPENKQ